MRKMRFSQLLLWNVWAPEADERRFFAGIGVTLLAILAAWTNGIGLMGRYTIPVAGGLWWILYLLKFGKRLQRRGELGRTILIPGAYILFLAGISLL